MPGAPAQEPAAEPDQHGLDDATLELLRELQGLREQQLTHEDLLTARENETARLETELLEARAELHRVVLSCVDLSLGVITFSLRFCAKCQPVPRVRPMKEHIGNDALNSNVSVHKIACLEPNMWKGVI